MNKLTQIREENNMISDYVVGRKRAKAGARAFSFPTATRNKSIDQRFNTSKNKRASIDNPNLFLNDFVEN